MICGVQFRPPVSLVTSVASLVFGGVVLAGATLFVSARVELFLTLIMVAMGTLFTLWGTWMIVQYAKTPVGPLSGSEMDAAGQE